MPQDAVVKTLASLKFSNADRFYAFEIWLSGFPTDTYTGYEMQSDLGSASQ